MTVSAFDKKWCLRHSSVFDVMRSKDKCEYASRPGQALRNCNIISVEIRPLPEVPLDTTESILLLLLERMTDIERKRANNETDWTHSTYHAEWKALAKGMRGVIERMNDGEE